MSQSDINSYYDVPIMSTKIDQAVRSIAENEPVGWAGLTTEQGWQTIGTGNVGIARNPFVNHNGTVNDWYLALDEADFRIEAYRPNPNQITFTFQLAKEYSFDHDLKDLGLTAPQLENLNTSGFAQNYFIVGQSQSYTIPFTCKTNC